MENPENLEVLGIGIYFGSRFIYKTFFGHDLKAFSTILSLMKDTTSTYWVQEKVFSKIAIFSVVFLFIIQKIFDIGLHVSETQLYRPVEYDFNYVRLLFTAKT